MPSGTSPVLRLAADNTLVNGNGKKVVLKGAGLGALLDILGKENYEVFFESVDLKLDSKLIAVPHQLFRRCGGQIPPGLRNDRLENSIQLHPLPLREETALPIQHRRSQISISDRVVELCAAHGIYTIFDLHAIPGGQNTDWHSDSPGHHTAFWDLMDYQNWVIELWKVIAVRYKDQPWIAGYNPFNEPTEKTEVKLLEFYDRVVKAIREVDPNHLIFLDANTFGSDFSFLAKDKTCRWKSWNGCVYSVHNYCKYGFPGFHYKSTAENCADIERSFERKCTFMRENNLPIWNGEFGPVYDSEGPEVQDE